MVKIKLEANDTEYKSEGKTVLEALENLPLTWENIKTKGMFFISGNKHRIERLMYLKPLRLLFANKLRKTGWASIFEKLLKAKEL